MAGGERKESKSQNSANAPEALLPPTLPRLFNRRRRWKTTALLQAEQIWTRTRKTPCLTGVSSPNLPSELLLRVVTGRQDKDPADVSLCTADLSPSPRTNTLPSSPSVARRTLSPSPSPPPSLSPARRRLSPSTSSTHSTSPDQLSSVPSPPAPGSTPRGPTTRSPGDQRWREDALHATQGARRTACTSPTWEGIVRRGSDSSCCRRRRCTWWRGERLSCGGRWRRETRTRPRCL